VWGLGWSQEEGSGGRRRLEGRAGERRGPGHPRSRDGYAARPSLPGIIREANTYSKLVHLIYAQQVKELEHLKTHTQCLKKRKLADSDEKKLSRVLESLVNNFRGDGGTTWWGFIWGTDKIDMDTRVQMLRTNNNTNGMCEAGGSNYIYGHMTEASPEGCGCAEKDCVGMQPIADPPSDERKKCSTTVIFGHRPTT